MSVWQDGGVSESIKVPTLRFRESRSDGRQVSLVSSSVFLERDLQTGLKVVTKCHQCPGEQTAVKVNGGKETRRTKRPG